MKKLVFWVMIVSLFSCKDELKEKRLLLEKRQLEALNSGIIDIDIVSDFKLRMTEGEYHKTAKNLVSGGKSFYSKEDKLYYLLTDTKFGTAPFQVETTFYDDTLRKVELTCHSAYLNQSGSGFTGSIIDLQPFIATEFVKKYGSQPDRLYAKGEGTMVFSDFWMHGNLVVEVNEHMEASYSWISITYTDAEIDRRRSSFKYNSPDDKGIVRMFSKDYQSRFYKHDIKPKTDL